MLFTAMECEVRDHFHVDKLEAMKDGYKDKITLAVTNNDEVLFHWCMLTAETADSDAEIILPMLIDLWVTIRGFSFAGSWLEIYKKKKKKALQRSKALRKRID